MIVVIQASNYSVWQRIKICWMLMQAKTIYFNGTPAVYFNGTPAVVSPADKNQVRA